MKKISKTLSKDEKRRLLKIAREAIRAAAEGRTPAELALEEFSTNLQKESASFVTLTKKGKLRGCIGALEASQPFVLDVQEHAVAAAFQDYRFTNIRLEELGEIEIEISRLSPMIPLEYNHPDELTAILRPGLDGVMITDGFRRATFLPQVWKKVGDVEDFLRQLCMKMGVEPDYWRKNHLEVFTYEVEEFKES